MSDPDQPFTLLKDLAIKHSVKFPNLCFKFILTPEKDEIIQSLANF